VRAKTIGPERDVARNIQGEPVPESSGQVWRPHLAGSERASVRFVAIVKHRTPLERQPLRCSSSETYSAWDHGKAGKPPALCVMVPSTL
jgi:hypothetical protein